MTDNEVGCERKGGGGMCEIGEEGGEPGGRGGVDGGDRRRRKVGGEWKGEIGEREAGRGWRGG